MVLHLVLLYVLVLLVSRTCIEHAKFFDDSNPFSPTEIQYPQSSGRNTTDWIQAMPFDLGAMYIDVNFTECGFARVPVVTTSLEGDGDHWRIVGITSVYNTTTSGFRVFVVPEHEKIQTAEYAKMKHWNVDWIAVGFTC